MTTANEPTPTTAYESTDTDPRQQRLQGLEINAGSQPGGQPWLRVVSRSQDTERVEVLL